MTHLQANKTDAVHVTSTQVAAVRELHDGSRIVDLSVTPSSNLGSTTGSRSMSPTRTAAASLLTTQGTGRTSPVAGVVGDVPVQWTGFGGNFGFGPFS
jgi:hypothetical protein